MPRILLYVRPPSLPDIRILYFRAPRLPDIRILRRGSRFLPTPPTPPQAGDQKQLIRINCQMQITRVYTVNMFVASHHIKVCKYLGCSLFILAEAATAATRTFSTSKECGLNSAISNNRHFRHELQHPQVECLYFSINTSLAS